MNRSLKLIIYTGCIMLIFSAFYFGYIITMNRVANQKPDPNEVIDDNPAGEYVSNNFFEVRITSGTVLQKKIKSAGTGKIIVEYEGKVPGELVNANESKFREYLKGYDIIEFSKDLVVAIKEMPYLPNCYVVRLEGQFVKVYMTDPDGNLMNTDIEPYQCKNSDDELIKGIEVDSIDKVWDTIGDYD